MIHVFLFKNKKNEITLEISWKNEVNIFCLFRRAGNFIVLIRQKYV